MQEKLEIVDIHSHLLPCVDDGSESYEDSIKVLKDYYECGVTDIILTPHFRRRFKLPPDELKKRFNDFKSRVENEVPVNLYLGQEIYTTEKIKEQLSRGEVMPLNNTKYLLLEFSFSVNSEISETVYELKALGYNPIVAHLERYSYADLEMARDIKSVGGLIQINVNSLFGFRNRHCKKIAKELLKEGLVDFIATDCHTKRKNQLSKAIKYVVRKCGIEKAKEMFFSNAQAIIKK